MPRRKIDRESGEPALTYRENRMVDQFVSNGGNATRAAVDAGYSPKRASVSQAQINPDEVIGSLASQMRADVTDCFGPDGAFSVDLARQNGVGHLLKVSTTILRKAGPDGSLRTTGDATKIEFLSPQTAALQLARITTAASGADSAAQNEP